MAMYTIVSEMELQEPVMVCAFSGWVDAASVATDAASQLAGETPVVAYFDPDELFDYRSSRPVLDIVEGITQSVAWPELTIRAARAGDRDMLVMTGTEPDLRWRAFASDIVDISHRLGVSLHMTLGAVPAAVPHTLPSPVMTTASSSEYLDENARVPPALRVPSAAVSIIDQALHRSGVPTVGYFAQVPHYVTGPYYDGIITLLGRVGARLGLELPLGDLREQSELQRKQLDEVVAGRPDAKEYVERLESLAAQENLPSGDELAAEIERYFRGQEPGGPGPFNGGAT